MHPLAHRLQRLEAIGRARGMNADDFRIGVFNGDEDIGPAFLDRPSVKALRRSEEEAFKRAAAIINRAIGDGLTEVEVLRFPNALCTDHGRAFNNREPGWRRRSPAYPRRCTTSGTSTCGREATK